MTRSLRNEGITTSWISAVDIALQHCVFQGTTVCVASGDGGSGSKQSDGKAHVRFPASDPYVLSVGGSTIGNITLRGHDECVWNDTFGIAPNVASGATGGGVSDYFDLPVYQANAGVPKSVNDGHVGRTVPDVAANASPNSGYPLKLANGAIQVSMDGTSASAPLWAGLIAVLNAAIGANLGFVNSILYAIGPAGFRDIVGALDPSTTLWAAPRVIRPGAGATRARGGEAPTAPDCLRRSGSSWPTRRPPCAPTSYPVSSRFSRPEPRGSPIPSLPRRGHSSSPVAPTAT